MATIDLSRSATDYRKHYKSVRAQQGRVFVDDDHNENERIHGEESRSELVEIVGPVGAPGDGFRLSNPRLTGGKIDFDLAAGSLYVGGHRLKLDSSTTFQTQADWLQIFGSNTLTAPAASRTDLVYVETYLVPVSSVEDSETFEVALGGPDTSTRMRQLQRVRVFTGITTPNCRDGWTSFAAWLKSQKRGTLNGENELIPDTQLKIQFANNGSSTDLCSPPVAGGYLGAENQAIRVQLVDQAHFTWGFDNASPLYRVKVDPVGGVLTQVTLLTEPKDQAHWPMANQIVELLPWSAVLPNNEKTSEISGFLTRVASSYDPDQKRFTIDPLNPLPATFGVDWQQRADAGQLAPTAGDVYFYMRVWNRGGDTMSQPAISFTTGMPADLTGTGLQVVFSGNDRPFSDYWIIAARPDSPDLVVPWSLESGRGPNGYRHFFAPLGVIQWTVAGGAVAGKVIDDCRTPFLPLTKIKGCCSVTVGDGENSFGQFTSIQQAIDSLPASGGEVCILRGTYKETFTLTNRTDIEIHGCGPDTIIAPDTGTVAITIDGGSGISLRNFAVEAPSMAGVLIFDGASDVTLRCLTVTARDQGAVIAKLEQGLVIEDCVLQASPLTADLAPGGTIGVSPLLYVAGRKLRVERNRIETDTSGTSKRTALGGVQIGGGSINVELRRNHIVGGNGNGITLGSVQYVANGTVFQGSGNDGGLKLTLFYYAFDPNNCVQVPGDPQTPPGTGTGNDVPVSEGNLEDVRIIDNRIEKMGENGIAPILLFFPAAQVDLITIYNLAIVDNTIWHCITLDVGPVSPQNITRVAFGGIILPDAEITRIDGNLIEDVGTSGREAICGIYVASATGIAIRENRLRRNGREASAREALKLGNRGGIIIRFAIAPTERISINLFVTEITGQRQDGMPAVLIHDNVVVSREGRALFVGALGPVFITDNQLTAHGSSFLALLRAIIGLTTGQSTSAGNLTGAASSLGAKQNVLPLLLDALGGTAVFVYDLGWSNEIYFQLLGLDSTGGALDPERNKLKYFVGGNIVFSDNQVVYDALDQVFAYSLCSVFLFTFDTITMADNQIQCDLFLDFVIINTVAIALSTQISGNRFTEGVFNTFLSGLTVGFLMNSTALNVATHCIDDIGWQKPSIVVTGGGTAPALRLNLILTDPKGTDATCQAFGRRTPVLVGEWRVKSVDATYLAQSQSGAP